MKNTTSLRLRRIGSLLLALLLTLSMSFAKATPARADNKQQELQQAKEEAQNKLNEINAGIKAAQANQAAAAELKQQYAQQETVIKSQITILYEQITAIKEQISNKETEIQEKQQQIEEKQAEYDERFAGFQERMRAMQRLDGGGGIWLLSQAKSLYQLLTFDTVLRQMNAKNSAVLAELDAEAAALEQARAEADTAVQQAAEAKAALESQQAALSATQSELEAALLAANSALTQQQAAAQAQAAVTDAAKKAYEDATAALDAYVREQSRRYTTADLHLTSLAFRCPLDSYGRITTQFAEPDPWGIPHRGTDFAAPGDTPIYAVADGVVSAARTMNSYGNCVQVSHGTADDGHRYDSLYAHMSSITVAEGTAVQKGDLLGYVGNTGNVYGAGGGYHLHLELRVDGARVNPLGYVPSR